MINVGVQGKLWFTIRDMYSQARSVVKWNGKTSMPFVVKQDVRQGDILSTLHYKLCNKALLLLLQRMCVGMSIGHIDCCAPTSADDDTLLTITTSACCCSYMLSTTTSTSLSLRMWY